MTKRRPGRPPGILKPDARRRKVTVRYTDAEYAQLEELARNEVLSVSDTVREATKLAIARGSAR